MNRSETLRRWRGGTVWLVAVALTAGLPAAAGALGDDAADAAAAAAETVETPERSETGEKAESKKPEGEKAEGEEPEAEQEGAAGQLQQEGSVLGTVRMHGSFELGVRAVDFDGSQSKFKEDVDLDDGPRLLDTRLVLEPAQRGQGRWFDRITLEADGLGGDPYESWAVSAYKTDAYKFQVRNRTVDFFWNVTGEIHAWDLTRTTTDASLEVTPVEGLDLYARFDRFRQDNFRVTSRDISREEFLFREPLDQDGSSYGFGVRWKFDRTLVFFDQELRQFNDNGGFGTRTFDPGLSPDGASLSFLEQREVRSVDAPVTRGGFQTTVADGRVDVSGDVLYSNQTLGFSFNRFWTGVSFRGEDVRANEDAVGEAEREVIHGNAAVRVRAHDKVYLQARYRRRSFDQTGDNFSTELEQNAITGVASTSREESIAGYEITHDQVLFGGEVLPTDRVSLYAEVGITRRDQQFFHDVDDVEHHPETASVAFKVGGDWYPDRRVSVGASYERGDIDDPFTRIAPTEVDMFKARVRLRPREGWQLGGHVTERRRENAVTPADFESRSWGASVTWSGAERGWVSGGFTRLEAESEVPIRFVFPFFGRFTTGTALYETEDNTVWAAAEYRVSSQVPLDLYGRFNVADSDGTVPLRFIDGTFGGRYHFERGFFLDLSLRMVDYEEDTELPSAIDDYDARVFTIGGGYRF